MRSGRRGRFEGNTRAPINTADPFTLQLVMDSLRYWTTVMGVDGFRFDLAPTLARDDGGFDRLAAFFDLVAQDPVVSRVKLIAEPWDVGRADSYDLGRFPPLWREWNGRYRDTVRDFWRSHDGLLGEFATRFAGSADLYGGRGRRPTASVNFVTAHDGFTLADLVTYDRKHNEANGDDNHDGTDDNRSWNCGQEGPTDDPEVRALRARQQRALLTTLLLSFGVPMLLDDDFLVLVNAWWEPVGFTVPALRTDQVWEPEIDTFAPAATGAHGKPIAGDVVTVGPRSVVVLRAPPTEVPRAARDGRPAAAVTPV